LKNIFILSAVGMVTIHTKHAIQVLMHLVLLNAWLQVAKIAELIARDSQEFP
jgi:hypothetical protein